jgi:predicted DNA-binding protein (MmcQ/YjbR family)
VPRSVPSQADVLAKLRALVSALPDVHEKASWGHPNFTAGRGGKIFVAFHEDRNRVPTIWLRVEPLAAEMLRGDPRLTPSAHGGAGWIGVRADGRIDWRLVRELASDGHELVRAKPRSRKPRRAQPGAAERRR